MPLLTLYINCPQITEADDKSNMTGAREALVQFANQQTAKRFINDMIHYNQWAFSEQRPQGQERNKILPGNNRKEARLVTEFKENQKSPNTLMIKWFDFETRRPARKDDAKGGRPPSSPTPRTRSIASRTKAAQIWRSSSPSTPLSRAFRCTWT